MQMFRIGLVVPTEQSRDTRVHVLGTTALLDQEGFFCREYRPYSECGASSLCVELVV